MTVDGWLPHASAAKGLDLLLHKLSAPFAAASKENIYHMLRQVSFYSSTLPLGKTKHRMSYYFEELTIQQSKRLDTFVHLFFLSLSLFTSLDQSRAPFFFFNRLPLTVT